MDNADCIEKSDGCVVDGRDDDDYVAETGDSDHSEEVDAGGNGDDGTQIGEPVTLDKKVPKMGKPCGPMCRQKCTNKLSENRRLQIFQAYWTMSNADKRLVIFHTISQSQTQRPSSNFPSRRNRSFKYHLNDDNGQAQGVCKTFFLTTLGYHAKNDRLISSVVGKSTPSTLTPPQDRRGRHAPSNKLNLTPIF